MKQKKISLIIAAKEHAKMYTNNTRHTWDTFVTIIETYDTLENAIPMDNSFNLANYNVFKNYLMSLEYKNNTICNITDKLKALLHALARQGYIISKDIDFMEHYHDESQAIFLTMDEINRIAKLELNTSLNQIRDRFIIGCLTGLRFSDYSRINGDNVIDANIVILNKKTNTKVVIPMHPLVEKILKKYKNQLPISPSQWFVNRSLPTIACKARINDKVIIERMIGEKITQEVYLKHELVRTHTARRSAATNMYLAGIPIYRIMLITGHESEQSFLKYIRISRQENATELTKHAFFQ